MLFTSITFLWCFLPLTLVVYWCAPKKSQNVVLLIASLLFYAWGEPKYIVLLMATIAISWFFGLLIDYSSSDTWRKVSLGLCVGIELGLLAYFKYLDFLIGIVNDVARRNIPAANIALPVGISFYIFQALSYVIDLYRAKSNKDGNADGIKVQKNILSLALYVSLFPQLIAGPIVKYHDVEKQIQDRGVSLPILNYGIKRFIYGLGKKVLIANNLAAQADQIFGMRQEQLSTPIAWIGIVCYTLQIYYDFSGYSDMAIGLGSMFGFHFLENFNYPYIADSVQDFWRRWHISLSTWFKEYLYIPLGGNRKGLVRTYLNLFIVFFVTGLWHGASWNFIAWGLFHGFFCILERAFLSEKLKWVGAVRHLYVMLVVLCAWVFFRADNLRAAISYLRTMFVPTTGNYYTALYFLDGKTVLCLIVAIALCGPLQTGAFNLKKRLYAVDVPRVSEMLGLGVIAVCSIMSLAAGAYNPFIYFRF